MFTIPNWRYTSLISKEAMGVLSTSRDCARHSITATPPIQPIRYFANSTTF